jgi:hypothetical protein
LALGYRIVPVSFGNVDAQIPEEGNTASYRSKERPMGRLY